MPKKSVRDMTKQERRRHSLSGRMFRSVLFGSVMLGLICLLIGLSLYTVAVAKQDISTAFNLSRNAAAVLNKTTDTETLSREVMERYRSLSDEERADPYSEEYTAHFTDIYDREDYRKIFSVLSDFQDSSDVFAIYLAMYDKKTDAIVYIVDPVSDPDLQCKPGEWESVDHKGLLKFLNWDGTGMLYEIGKTELYGWMCTAGVPVRARSGEITGFVLADVTLDNVISGVWKFVLQFTVGILISVVLFSILFLRRMQKTVVNPINSITDAAQRYTADKKAGIQKTDHFANLNIQTGDEIENLALTVKDMEYDLTDYEKNLTRITAEKEHIHTELSLANKIQADMLPNIFPAFPDRDEFEIYASMTPAREVGGDFYDFFFIDHDRLAMVIADVSGKGIPAAMFMVMAKGIIQTQCMSGQSPARIMTEVNKMICSNNREKMFVTVWLGILDVKSGVLTAANAGHEYPIMMDPDSDFEVIKDKHGFVVGGFESMKYKEYTLQMMPGSKLFVYTDGVPEATNADNEMFGLERTVASMNKVKDSTPHTILETVTREVCEFVGDAEPFDDLTMMCVEYFGEPAAEELAKKELRMPAEVDSLPRIIDFVDAELDALNCLPATRVQINVAIDEIFANIAFYAYPDKKGDAVIRLQINKSKPEIILTFIDSGIPFNPLKAKDPDIRLPAGNRKIGGLGIFMVKKTMDSVSYEYKDGQNRLTIKRKLNQ